MKVAFFGSLGKVGREICPALEGAGYDVLGVDVGTTFDLRDCDAVIDFTEAAAVEKNVAVTAGTVDQLAIQTALKSSRKGAKRALFDDCLTGAWVGSVVPPIPTDRQDQLSLSAGDLDEAAVRRLGRRQIDAGIHFLVPCGTTGENPTLSHWRMLASKLHWAQSPRP